MSFARELRALIGAPEILVTPGIYDAFSAFRAQQAGFKAVVASGSALAAMPQPAKALMPHSTVSPPMPKQGRT